MIGLCFIIYSFIYLSKEFYCSVRKLQPFVFQLPCVCACLQEVPENIVLHVLEMGVEEKGAVVRAWLVQHQVQPLPWISAAIEHAMMDTDPNR